MFWKKKNDKPKRSKRQRGEEPVDIDQQQHIISPQRAIAKGVTMSNSTDKPEITLDIDEDKFDN